MLIYLIDNIELFEIKLFLHLIVCKQKKLYLY